MSVDASININLAKHDFQVSSFEIVKILTKNGWHLIHDKTINYLIIGDKDCSNWEIKTT